MQNDDRTEGADYSDCECCCAGEFTVTISGIDAIECDVAKLQRVKNSADLLILKDSVHELLGYEVMR